MPKREARRMLRMLNRHAVQALLRAGVRPRAVARQFRISRLTVGRIANEASITPDPSTADPTAASGAERATRAVGRPRVDETLRSRVQAWLTEAADLRPGEVWRRLREEGTRLGGVALAANA